MNYHSMVVLKRIDSIADFMLVDLVMDNNNKIHSRVRPLKIPQKFFNELIMSLGLNLRFWEYRKDEIVVLSQENGLCHMGTIDLKEE
jgi:hypothetical protein